MWELGSHPGQINDSVDQEWFARYDRQRLCRDIYTVMYLYCGGEDKDYTAANPYPDNDSDGIPDELKEMAQFAVNLVDRMDPDNVITKFEYDFNL